MANTILNFHFDYLHTSLRYNDTISVEISAPLFFSGFPRNIDDTMEFQRAYGRFVLSAKLGKLSKFLVICGIKNNKGMHLNTQIGMDRIFFLILRWGEGGK